MGLRFHIQQLHHSTLNLRIYESTNLQNGNHKQTQVVKNQREGLTNPSRKFHETS